jgi:sterol desaturase/sphingolipid hydroxylase (fatty acid hydroxylase superfamily)
MEIGVDLKAMVEVFSAIVLPNFLFRARYVFSLLFIFRAIFFTTLEVFRPARAICYRAVIWNDLAACAMYVLVVYPAAARLSQIVPGHHPYPAAIAGLPLPLRVLLYFVLADFGHYWVHRLIHHPLFWPVHKWHHSPTYMYWLGGVRATLSQQFLVNIPYVLAYPLLDISSWWLAWAVAVSNVLQNDWMHMNFTWRSNWLEWIIVTPRYHHIHHSADPQHYTTNLGNLFTIWDRLFGTYVNPESVQTELSFGIGTQENPLRLFVGV